MYEYIGRYYTGRVPVIQLRSNKIKTEKSSKNLQSFVDIFDFMPRIIM